MEPESAPIVPSPEEVNCLLYGRMHCPFKYIRDTIIELIKMKYELVPIKNFRIT